MFGYSLFQPLTIRRHTLLLAYLLLACPASASTLDYPNRYRPMAESMFDMLDAFSNAYQQRLPSTSPLPNPTPGMNSGWLSGTPMPAPMPGIGSGWPSGTPLPTPTPGIESGGSPGTPNWFGQAASPNPLEGSWRGRGGEILVIRNGWFRIYKSRQRYREGQVRLNDARTFSLYDRQGGNRRDYEFAEQRGRLVLRDPNGSLLLYRRID